MKTLKTLLISILIVGLSIAPAQQATAVGFGDAAAKVGAAAVKVAPGVALAAVKAAPAAMAFAAAHPIIIASGGILVSAGVAYGAYKTYKVTTNAAWTVAPYIFIPFANQWGANQAVKADNPGFLDFSLSTGRLIKMFQKVPFFGEYVPDPVKLNDGQLHTAIRGDKRVADVMIDRHSEAGIDLNKEHLGQRPTDVALGHSDRLSEKLIKHDQVDLDTPGHRGAGQNLFHDVLASNKRELIDAAVRRGDAVRLMDTVDEHGNPVPTLAAVSPGLRAIIDGSGNAPSAEAFAAANRAGLTPADAILHAHRAGDASPADVVRYLDAPAQLVIQDQGIAFRETLAHPGLSAAGVPERLVERGAIPTDRPDAAGQTPIEHAISRDNDALAARLAPQTSPDVLRAQHSYGRALLHRLTNAAEAIRVRIGFGTRPDDRLDFFRNPLGEGRSILAHLIEGGGADFDPVLFRDAYRHLTDRLGGNPLEHQTLLQANLLQSAASLGNQPAVATILEIMAEEGFGRHIAILAGGAHETVPLLIAEGYGPDFAQAATISAARPEDRGRLRGSAGATARAIEGLVDQAERAGHITLTDLDHLPPLLEPRAGGDPSRTPLAIRDRPEDGTGTQRPAGSEDGILVLAADGRAIVPARDGGGTAIVVRDEFMEHQRALRDERLAGPARERQQQADRVRVQEHDAAAARDDRGRGLPQRRDMRPVKRAARIPVPQIRQNALLGGYFASNVIDQRGGLGHVILLIPGVDKVLSKETVHDAVNNHELAWGTAYFAASLAMSYGANTGTDLFATSNLRNAGLNTGLYAAKRYFHGSPKMDDLPPVDKRGTWDFVKRYGPSVTANMGWTVLRTGLMIYITGATMGTAGVILPVAMTLGTDFLTYYDAYTKDQRAESTGWDSYLAPYLVASMATMSYVSNIATLATGGGGIDTNMRLIQNLFGGLVTFGTTHQLSSLVYENFGKPSVKKALSPFSWAYRKVFGSKQEVQETLEEQNRANNPIPTAPVPEHKPIHPQPVHNSTHQEPVHNSTHPDDQPFDHHHMTHGETHYNDHDHNIHHNSDPQDSDQHHEDYRHQQEENPDDYEL